MTPLARSTSRTLRSVAPMDSSIPRARSRRCASTVKPPTDTSAISSMPTVANASTMVSGLSRLLLAAAVEAGVETLDPMRPGSTPGASKRTSTCVGCVTWPGGTSANSSSRLWGFCTMPTTVLPPRGQVSPTARLSSDASPGVSGDLVRPGRIVPGEQLEHRPAVGAVRILGPELVRLGAAGDVESLVLYRPGPAEAVLQRGDLGGHRMQIEVAASRSS